MAWKIFNIGKANAEIERLEKELQDAKAGPAADSKALADALASNETISAQLTSANDQISTLTTEKTDLTDRLEKATSEVNTLGAQLKAAGEKIDGAVKTLKQEVKADATLADKLVALEQAVTNTLAGMGLAPEAIPSAPAGKSAGAASIDQVVERFQAITDPREKAEEWRKNKATLRAGFTPRKTA